MLIVSCSGCGERTETRKLDPAIDVLAEHMGHGHVTVRSADTVAGGCYLAIQTVKWGPRHREPKPMQPTSCVNVPGSNVLTTPRWLPERVVS